MHIDTDTLQKIDDSFNDRIIDIMDGGDMYGEDEHEMKDTTCVPYCPNQLDVLDIPDFDDIPRQDVMAWLDRM